MEKDGVAEGKKLSLSEHRGLVGVFSPCEAVKSHVAPFYGRNPSQVPQFPHLQVTRFKTRIN